MPILRLEVYSARFPGSKWSAIQVDGFGGCDSVSFSCSYSQLSCGFAEHWFYIWGEIQIVVISTRVSFRLSSSISSMSSGSSSSSKRLITSNLNVRSSAWLGDEGFSKVPGLVLFGESIWKQFSKLERRQPSFARWWVRRHGADLRKSQQFWPRIRGQKAPPEARSFI